MRWRRQRRKGAALVELALCLPLLLIILLGATDFGRFAYYHVALTDAVGAGAKFASYHSFTASTQANWQTQVRAAVDEGMSGIVGFERSKLTISNPEVFIDSGQFSFQRVRVTASYNFQTLVPWPGIPSATTLRRSVDVRMVR
jgi:Flp pilus assembly protein TadG